MNIDKKVRIVTWNKRSDQFHIGSATEQIERGLDTYFGKMSDEWIMLGIFEDVGDAMKYTDHLREKRRTMRDSQRE